MRTRGFDFVAALALFCGAALSAPPARAVAFVQSIAQVCEEGNNCQTGTPVMVPGQQADRSRAWDFDGFHYAASAAIVTDYVAWSAFARGSGLENPENPGSTTFNYLISRGGNAYGHVFDTITAGTGGGAGFLRLPLHLVGNTAISWQNGFGATSFSLTCSSSVPGTATVIGSCDPVFANFTNDAVIDQDANLDIPILLGSPVQFTASLIAGAGTGHQYGDLIPFTGQAEITIATLPFEGAIVLDAGRQPIPGATVTSAESGFDYNAPEAASPIAAAATLCAVASLRRRRL